MPGDRIHRPATGLFVTEALVDNKKKDRTINARLSSGDCPTSDSLNEYHNDLLPASVSHRADALWQSDGRRPMYLSHGNT
ncbi:hypothetical protein DPMN_170383 [Dreissena polymorpha]|uniref:Uncharacterized protein n=1 Tax=Dreissena polymorpha TaxID=45954 RepID=A0A9D4DYH1_DREPO|nr:hypothetical protein DPMN_170383 [Dreissena polymorpha]